MVPIRFKGPPGQSKAIRPVMISLRLEMSNFMPDLGPASPWMDSFRVKNGRRRTVAGLYGPLVWALPNLTFIFLFRR